MMPHVPTQPIPLSHGQQRLWFLDTLQGAGREFNLLEAQRFHGPLDIVAFGRAYNALVARHESLRTRFVECDGEPRQIVEPVRLLPLPVVDLAAVACDRVPALVSAALRRARAEPYDLSRGPLLRLTLLRTDPETHVFLRAFHHIAFDGWSRAILNREIALLYHGFRFGADPSLPPLPLQYADFAVWQRQWLDEDRLRQGLTYWKEQLDRLPDRVALPADRPRPAAQTFTARVYRSTVPEDRLSVLKQASRRHRLTPYMMLLAGLALLFHRYTGQDDVVVGSPMTDRRDLRFEGLIGFFVNLIPLRIRTPASLPVHELLADVRRTALAALKHQDTPFDRIVDAVAPQRSRDRAPIFETLFAVQNLPTEPAQFTGVSVEPVLQDDVKIGVDLEIDVAEREGRLEISWLYNRDLFDTWRIAQMARHYARLLEGIAAYPDTAIGDLPLLNDAERLHVLEACNATTRPYPEASLAARFEAQAAAYPDSIVVVCGDAALSYRALDERADTITHLLLDHGARPEDVVALAVPRSLAMIAAMLGVLKAGAAYLPLDSEAPAARLALMIQEAAPRCVLTTRAVADRLPEAPARVMLDDAAIGRGLSRRVTGSPDMAARAAHVIFTSGSSGQPKGVVGLQDALMNRLAWFGERYDFRRDGPVLAKSAISFIDGSTELLGPVLHGGTVVLADSDAVKSAADLTALIVRHRIGLITVVPSLLRALLDEAGAADLSVCGTWITSGEALPRAYAELFARVCPGATLLNLYGASEASGDSLWHVAHDGDVAIGAPVWNTRVYVLDRALAPVAVGLPGELYLAGAGLARGYLHQPVLTAARFIPDPFGLPGTRMYRTGDLAQRRPDGCLEYLGRADDQVKIRGFRVEPGEVQAALIHCRGVDDAVVLAREDARGEIRLIGYVVPEPGCCVDPRGLRDTLRRQLPDYLIPSAIIPIPYRPLTPHGKLERRALPEPDPSPLTESPAPATPDEQRLCGLFAEVLGIERVSMSDSFFDLGGHSLLAMRLVNRVRSAFGVDLPVRVLFDASTIGDLSEHLERLRSPLAARRS